MRVPLAAALIPAAAGLVMISVSGGDSLAQRTILSPGPIQSQRVVFPAGAESTLINGRLKGYQTVDYTLRASAGQTLTAALQASNGQTYFNVMAAGASNAQFIGSISGHSFRGLLPSDGDVKVRVYLMRPAARRNETTTYSLRLAISGSPLAPLPASQDALIAGTPYHASGEVPCMTRQTASCKASVIRRANNSATVVVITPEGQTRQFLFVKGRAMGTDQPDPLAVRRRGDVSVLTLGENLERYEIADALVMGG
jgi:hypothetical protein